MKKRTVISIIGVFSLIIVFSITSYIPTMAKNVKVDESSQKNTKENFKTASKQYFFTNSSSSKNHLFTYDLADGSVKEIDDINALAEEGTYTLYQDRDNVYALTTSGKIFKYSEKLIYLGYRASLHSKQFGKVQFWNGDFYYTYRCDPINLVSGVTGETQMVDGTINAVKLSTKDFSETTLKTSSNISGVIDTVANDSSLFILEFSKENAGCKLEVTDYTTGKINTFVLENCECTPVKIVNSIDNYNNLYVTVQSREEYVHDILYRINLDTKEVTKVYSVPKIGSVITDGKTTYVSYAEVMFDEDGYHDETSFLVSIDKNGTEIKKRTLKSPELNSTAEEIWRMGAEEAKKQGYVIANEPLNIIDIVDDDLIISFNGYSIQYFTDLPFGEIITINKNSLN